MLRMLTGQRLALGDTPIHFYFYFFWSLKQQFRTVFILLNYLKLTFSNC